MTPPQVIALGCEHSLMTGSAEIRADLAVHFELISVSGASPLIDAQLSESEPKPKDDFSRLVIYYPHGRERMWDIARRYNTTISDIAAANGISADIADGDTVLLIPQK